MRVAPIDSVYHFCGSFLATDVWCNLNSAQAIRSQVLKFLKYFYFFFLIFRKEDTQKGKFNQDEKAELEGFFQPK